jgi:hypothetical protein
MRAPELTVPQILGWLDETHERTGKWAIRTSGRIVGSLGETWCAVDLALNHCGRGLTVKSSLAQLLFDHRGVRNRSRLPRFTQKLILEWCDAEKSRSGLFPTRKSGPIRESPGDTWQIVDQPLRNGIRGLPGDSSLARLLHRKRGYRNLSQLPRLTEILIATWADAHLANKGTWPRRDSGPVFGAPGETWARISNALVQGDRGLPGGSSLAQLLAKHRNVRNQRALPKLRKKTIALWADDHLVRKGKWPTHTSGPIEAAPGETWAAVNTALQRGLRGLPGGSSLFQLLHRYRKVPRYGRVILK